jgi:antitoxin HigA-1
MTTYKALRDPNRCPSHPGATLADILMDAALPKPKIAELLGISRQHLHDILAERKSVSPTIAAHIGKVFGGGATLIYNSSLTHSKPKPASQHPVLYQ